MQASCSSDGGGGAGKHVHGHRGAQSRYSSRASRSRSSRKMESSLMRVFATPPPSSSHKVASTASSSRRSEQWTRIAAGVCVPLGVFGAVAFDVFGGGSVSNDATITTNTTTMTLASGIGTSVPHFFSTIDDAVHVAVTRATTADFRAFWAGRVISNLPVVCCALALIPSTAFVAFRRGRDGAITALSVIAVCLLIAYGGSGINVTSEDNGDASVVERPSSIISAMKRTFHRARPSAELESTYAFPSGHTFVAAGCAGTLFMLVYPEIVLGSSSSSLSSSSSSLAAAAKTRAAPSTRPQSDEDIDVVADDDIQFAKDDIFLQNGTVLVFAIAVVTALGRILADVHWVSDTVAGGCLGIAAVNLMILVRLVLVHASDAVLRVSQMAITDVQINEEDNER